MLPLRSQIYARQPTTKTRKPNHLHPMTCKCANKFLWLLIILGILLRLTDVAFPDFATDEAQFALNASAAQPPVGMFFFWLSQAIFGASIISARLVSIILGIATIYQIVLTFSDKKVALTAAAVASIFPTHIIFSKLAYLSVPLCFAWALTALMFIKANKKPNDSKLLIGLFLSSVLATFIKTQGLLLPFFLLIGTIIVSTKNKKALSIINYQLSIILALSLLPITLYILTNPGIGATLTLYGGNMYGVSDFLSRIWTLIHLWWTLIPLLLILFILSSKFYLLSSKNNWPIYVLILTGVLLGLLLGPAHEYYTTYLVYWSIPVALLLNRMKPCWTPIILTLIVVNTLLLTGPRSIFLNGRTYKVYQNEGYWNTHATKINEVLKGVDEVIVLGHPGHHIRWYLEPRTLVGKNMDLTNRKGVFLNLSKELPVEAVGEVLYDDEKVVITRK